MLSRRRRPRHQLHDRRELPTHSRQNGMDDDETTPLLGASANPHTFRSAWENGIHDDDEPIVSGQPGKPETRPRTECHTRKERVIQHERVHPLFAAARHNQAESPLCRLPDKVLARILQVSDVVTVQCLRQSSRIFLRLAPTARHKEEYTRSRGDRYPWPTFTQRWLPEHAKTFASLLTRDEYACEDCVAARHSADWQARVTATTKTYLHCSGCQADHPVCLFSVEERRKDLSKRVCIGHEGCMSLCKHVRVPWSLVLAVANGQIKPDRRFSMIQCTKGGHSQGCPHDGAPRLRDVRGGSGSWEPNAHGYHSPKRRFPVTMGERFVVMLEWQKHLPLPLGTNGRLQAEELERGIKELYEEEGRFICPPLRPGPAFGTELFDPCRCDCLEYAGGTGTAWERPPKNWRTWTTCRTDPSRGIDPSREDQDCATIDGFHKDILSDRFRCNRRVRKVSRWMAQMANISKCWGGEGCLIVDYVTTVMLPADGRRLSKMDRNWYAALDPDSYGLTNDIDGFGIYWCKAEGCRNYYRFICSRLQRLLEPSDYSRMCPP